METPGPTPTQATRNNPSTSSAEKPIYFYESDKQNHSYNISDTAICKSALSFHPMMSPDLRLSLIVS